MSSPPRNPASSRTRVIQQTIKWIVYSLLIVNFLFYIAEDWNRASHTLNADATLLDWAAEFATSIDESAWFILLAMFELETYVIEDQRWTARLSRVVHGARLVCYAMLAHTVFAYAGAVRDYQPTVEIDGISDLCDLAGAGLSFVSNLEYTEINEPGCGELSNATQFFKLGDESLVTDLSGLQLERALAGADLAEAIIWLLILAAIEVMVRLQGKGFAGGPLLTSLNAFKYLLYLALISIAIWWATLSHWLYFWDELVWIGGFAAIDMNLSEWREELEEQSN